LYNKNTIMTVSSAYAKANLPELLKAVERGETVTILRYKTPIADIVPSKDAVKVAPKFGTGKGKVKILDPNWASPMTNADADAFLEGRY
jgi:antitoxin (DNA-binding transcriptional repressor) of toxin-antitoxin stability system